MYVNNDGTLAGGVSGDDVIITGDVGPYLGTLLTGEVVAFGYLDFPDLQTDRFFFRFRATGGRLYDAGLYLGRDIGAKLVTGTRPGTSRSTGPSEPTSTPV